MISDVICNLIGISIFVAGTAAAISCWRRGVEPARALFWLRQILILNSLWGVICCSGSWFLAPLNLLGLALLCPQHLSACIRLSRMREAFQDNLRLDRLVAAGHTVSVSFSDECFSVAEGWRS